MTLANEQMQILEMISEGKVSAEEGEQLLKALNASESPPKKLQARLVTADPTATGYSPSMGASLVAELRKLGIEKIGLSELQELRLHQITPEYIREIAELGMDDIDIDELVNLRLHNVTPQFIRELHKAGITDLDPDDLTECVSHNVTPEFLRGMREAGLTDLDIDELVEYAVHNVTPEYVREMRQIGMENLDHDDLIECAIHKITPEFARDALSVFPDIDVDQLVEMANKGMSHDELRELKDSGFLE